MKTKLLWAPAIVLLVLLFASSCGGTIKAMQINVPDNIRAELESKVPSNEYVFYALKDSKNLTWDKFRKQGLVLCGDVPPLLKKWPVNQSAFDSGTVVTIDTDKELGFKVRVPIGGSLESRAEWAVGEMEKSPSLILLTERKTEFKGKDQLSEVVFK